MARIGETLSLTIDRPAVGGPMIARAEQGIILVSGAIPGERITARVDRIARHVVFATATEIHDASPDRRLSSADPSCGGGLYAHITYPRQLAIKGEVIADAFSRIGRLTLPAPAVVNGSREDGYRMRARLHVRGRRIGFFREGTHDICDPRPTRQLLPESCDTLDRLAAAIRSFGDVVREIELSENVAATERVVHLETTEPIQPRALASVTTVDGLTEGPFVTDTLTIGDRALILRRHVRAFFQGNRYLLADLVRHVSEFVPAGGTLLDLYAGAGLFSLGAAQLRGASVTAVEVDPFAVGDLQANAKAAGGRVEAVRADVETFAARARATDAIVVDPPRTGLSREASDAVLALRSPRLIYVSCDVATLARDARRIVDAGYTIERADAFDLFPNTPHVETVVLFRR